MAVVGVDIGATKTHLALARDGAAPRERILATTLWRVRRHEADARTLLSLIQELAAVDRVAALAVGAHGCDSAAECLALQTELDALARLPLVVVNDAELLAPAAGFHHGIGVVAGTGSIAVARLADRTMLVAGGWGWVLGDEGGAVGLVREAVRAARGTLDSGRNDDVLIPLLKRSLGTDDPTQFGRALAQAADAARIGAHVEAVFAAVEAGSTLAERVVREGGRALARLARQLIGRGATGGHVVAGGGVITRQALLADSFSEALRADLPDWRATILRTPPVQGALALARQIAAGRTPFGLRPSRLPVQDAPIAAGIAAP